MNPPVGAPLQVDTLFPDLNDIPQFPAPFSLDPSNRSPYTMQWNVNLQRSLGRDYLVEAAYTGSRSRNLSKRYNINQADFGTTPINSRLPFPQFQPAMLYSSATGWANFKGLSLRLEKRYSAGLFFLANYQLSENRDNGSGEVEANDTAFRTDLDADASLSRLRLEAVRKSDCLAEISGSLGGSRLSGVRQLGTTGRVRTLADLE